MIEVAAAVVERRGRYLVAQRPADRRFGGMWEFPGGKREAHESLAACLRRELLEELGLEASVGAPLAVIRSADGRRRAVIHFFRCRIPAGRVTPSEGQAIRWVTPRELAGLPLPPADAEVAIRLRRRTRIDRPAR